MSLSFYSEIPAFRSRRDIARPENYRELPPDWSVVIVDIRGSTKAIEQGRYRDVNTVGASSIMASINCLRGIEFPYVFGGDGATLLVPTSRVPELAPVLDSVREMSARDFQLELRIGIVGNDKLRAAGHKVLVGEHAISPHISLAVLNGAGISQAEAWIKDPAREAEFRVPAPEPREANYEGLECRWSPLTAQKGEFVSVLIKTLQEDMAESSRIYGELVEEVELLFGGGDAGQAQMYPANKDNLRVSLSPRKLLSELKVRTSGKGLFAKMAYFTKLFLSCVYGVLVFRWGLKSKSFDWMNYYREVGENSDFWKYDDMLRFVLDVPAVQKRTLVNLLELRAQRGEIAYGIHLSNSAIMTCLVFERKGAHVHFVDGGDGGYAQAAKMLKSQLKAKTSAKPKRALP